MGEKGFVGAKQESDAWIRSRCIPGVTGVPPAARGREGLQLCPGESNLGLSLLGKDRSAEQQRLEGWPSAPSSFHCCVSKVVDAAVLKLSVKLLLLKSE